MNEESIEQENQTQYDWHNNSFTIDESYYYPQLPLNRERISPTGPPRRLKEDKELGDGFQFLQEFGNRISLHIRYSPHRNAEDFGGDEFEQQVKESDIYLLEQLGWTDDLQQGLDNLADHGSFSSSNTPTLNYLTRDELHRRIGAAISGTKTRIGFADIHDGTDELRRGMINQAGLIQVLRDNATGGLDQDKKRAEIINTVAFESLREWFMVGELGQQVAGLCQNDPDLLYKLNNHTLKALLTVGSTHKNITDKLSPFGMQITEQILGHEQNAANDFVEESIGEGKIDRRKLEEVIR
jgi:hypothetical protein